VLALGPNLDTKEKKVACFAVLADYRRSNPEETVRHNQETLYRTWLGRIGPGDLDVVLLALNTPLILRLVHKGHGRIVGEAHVNGMLEGYAFEGNYKLRDFLIH
jgi:hypothetical protein